jgi:spermidine synthase
VKPFELIGETLSADGTVIKLVSRNAEYFILADGAPLMSSRMHGSEDALATFACERFRNHPRPSVLIGGLGMGFTLRATLDLLSANSTVVVSELLPAVVDWNRGPLGPVAGNPLKDRRVRLAIEDVNLTLRSNPGVFDAVLLDVDNGPAEFTVANNAALYDSGGLAGARAALKKDGVLAIWAAHEDEKFAKRLRQSGFDVQVRRIRAHANKKGSRHTIFLGYKT